MKTHKKLHNKEHNNSKKEILIESWSPVCDIKAYAERTKNTVYFYLCIDPDSRYHMVKPCWICNRVLSEIDNNYDALKIGNAPLMPLQYINHDKEGIDIDKDSLSIIWFEEGDAAALLENNKLLAVIPGWAENGFRGYSRYAVGAGPFAWELIQAEENLYARVKQSQEYWDYMQSDYFGELQDKYLCSLEKFFGDYEKYYAIDDKKFPKTALVTGSINDVSYAFTIGSGALCQPRIEQYLEDDFKQYRRIEFGFACNSEFKNHKDYMKMLNYISSEVNIPWREVTWLGNGHVVPCNAIEGFEAILLLNANMFPEIKSPKYADFRGERINLLWMIPLTKEEYKFAINNKLDTLLDRYKDDMKEIIIFNQKKKFI